MAMPDPPWPRWVYVPGRGGAADRETLERVKALVPARFDRNVPMDHAAFLYGVALNDRGFFWECHEILEAVWKAAPPSGRDKILLRALIQVANANLKQVMGQPAAVARLFTEALAELDEVSRRRSDCDGIAALFPSSELADVLRARLDNRAVISLVMRNSHGSS